VVTGASDCVEFDEAEFDEGESRDEAFDAVEADELESDEVEDDPEEDGVADFLVPLEDFEAAATAELCPLLLNAGSFPETSWKKRAAQTAANATVEPAMTRLRMRCIRRRRWASRPSACLRAWTRCASSFEGVGGEKLSVGLIFASSVVDGDEFRPGPCEARKLYLRLA
jgi:hypothetical protein